MKARTKIRDGRKGARHEDVLFVARVRTARSLE